MATKAVSELEDVFNEHILRGELAGVVALVWRPGEPIRRIAIGRRDVDRDLPASPDTLFRIASMTKPVTTVAALSLLDEGRFGLDDPIARFAPELGNLRVLSDPKGPLDNTVAAGRTVTFRD